MTPPRRRSDDDLEVFEHEFVAFIRSFGLLAANTTPCGQPLPTSQGHALTRLATRPGLSQQELASELGLARATISELIAQIEARGWVQRTPDEQDGRVRRLRLTADGERIAAAISTARRAHLQRILDAIDPVERAGAIRSIAALARAARATTGAD